MKKRRLAAWLMVLCLCAAALGGCGAKEEDKKADTAKEEQAKKDDKAKSQTPIKVGALKGPTVWEWRRCWTITSMSSRSWHPRMRSCR